MESKIVLLSLFSRATHKTGSPSPKSYPPDFAIELNKLLIDQNYYTIQIGLEQEPEIRAKERINSPPIPKLIELIKNCEFFISVDNILNHMAHFYQKRGIVIFSQSSPEIFGYKENLNLLKDKKYLRPPKQQFEYWEQTPYIKAAFVSPSVILDNIKKL